MAYEIRTSRIDDAVGYVQPFDDCIIAYCQEDDTLPKREDNAVFEPYPGKPLRPTGSDLLDEIQELYSFWINNHFINYYHTLSLYHNSHTLSPVGHVRGELPLPAKTILTMETTLALAYQDARLTKVNISVWSGKAHISLSVTSQYTTESYGSFLLFTRLRSVDGKVTYCTRCHLIRFNANDPVEVLDRIPMPRTTSQHGRIIDNEGNLLSDALTPPSVICDIHLGTRRLHTQKLRSGVEGIYQEIMRSL